MQRPGGGPAARAVVDGLARARATGGLVRLARGAASGWRRSLRTRVVTATVVLSLAVVALLGTFLVDRVTSGLLRAKEESALAEAGEGTRYAQQQFDAVPDGPGALKVNQVAVDVVRRLATGGGTDRRNDILLVCDQEAAGSGTCVDYVRSDADEGTIPRDLREAVRSQPGQALTYLAMPSGRGETVPGLAVGEQVLLRPAGTLELYYLFPLQEEQATLLLLQRTLGVAGVFLVVLVGLIAWVVTRQVVTPVRMAARIAERLASGRLEERMLVRGEDDLALLATSFNEMAVNLQRQIHQLEDLSRVQRRFVSDVSHELRTPLTTVRMAADVLHEARTDFPPAVARSAELLQAQLDRFEALLADLLEISRYDAGAAVLEPEPVDLSALAQRVVEASEPLAERKGSPVRVVVPSEPCIAEVDPRRIDRVLRNLVVNAIEHGEGRAIEVRVSSDDDAVAVAVRDHGVGLRPGEAVLVFGRFWRADPARARTTGGTGLGLSIALEDAHLHGGWLQAWGEPGEGSQFRLTLPRRAGGELSASPIPLQPADVRRRRLPAPVAAIGRGQGAGTAAGAVGREVTGV